MKKTFNINISGIIFHIDEDAYQKLNAYLERLKLHFKGTKGSEEIINDIESRIAELLQEKLSDKKQVINLQDVNETIKVMGEPGEFSEEYEAEGTTSETYTYYRPRKRLYRDPENKVIGGVSSGVAHYLNIDPIWIRLLFLVTLFAGGTGVIIYIIMWILVPEARTTAERLEMRGEPVTIDNIERSIRDEFENLKSRINDLSSRAAGAYKKKSGGDRNFFENLMALFVDIIRIFFRFIVIIIGVALFIAGVSLLIAFIAAVFNWGAPFYVNGDEWMFLSIPFLSGLILDPSLNLSFFNLSIYLVVGIPIVMLIYIAVRMIFRLERTRFVGLIAFGFWMVGLIALSYYSMTIVRDFKEEARIIDKTDINIAPSDTLVLQVNNNSHRDYRNKITSGNFPSDEVLFTEHDGILAKIELEIKKSNNEETALIIKKYARGRHQQAATENADGIFYDYLLNENRLVVNKYFRIPDRQVWRGQEANALLELPVGQIILVNEEAKDVIEWWTFSYSEDRDNSYFIMTEDGLKATENQEVKEDAFDEGLKPTATYQPEAKAKNLHPVAFILTNTIRYIGSGI